MEPLYHDSNVQDGKVFYLTSFKFPATRTEIVKISQTSSEALYGQVSMTSLPSTIGISLDLPNPCLGQQGERFLLTSQTSGQRWNSQDLWLTLSTFLTYLVLLHSVITTSQPMGPTLLTDLEKLPKKRFTAAVFLE